jgi:hypothetical protein
VIVIKLFSSSASYYGFVSPYGIQLFYSFSLMAFMGKALFGRMVEMVDG